uniref:MARVEL domain-containing protein n=2 Tax=Parascaris univalens TaxID=6257 RepID=A0A915ALE2_PARUN
MEAPPRYRRQAQRGPFYTLIGMLPCTGGPFKYGYCSSNHDLLCMKVDMRNLLHGAFLVNSMILAICFLVFDLEWRREVFNAKSNCAWQTEILELFINAVAVYFVILTLISATTLVLCIAHKPNIYKNAFYLLTLYSSATFILSIILSASYFLGSRVVAEHCVSTSEIEMLELRMCLVSVVGIITNGIYMIVGIIQGAHEINGNVTGRMQVSVAYDNQIFRLSTSEFINMPPPPPYSSSDTNARGSPIIARSEDSIVPDDITTNEGVQRSPGTNNISTIGS